MSKRKKKLKKVNQLTLQECKNLLTKLSKNKESLYYQHILEHYRRLMPSMGSAVELGKVTVQQGETAKYIKKENFII